MAHNGNVKSPARLDPILVLGLLVAVLAVFSPLGNLSTPETGQSSQESVDRAIAGPIGTSASFSAYFIHIRYDNWSALAVPGIQARDGTATNPHLIENFTINAGKSPTGSGIFIEHSKQHFIIRNCMITNASTTSNTAGIKLLNVTNGQLVGNNCSRNRYAGILLMTNSDYNIIQGNIAFDNLFFGILLNGQCDRNIIQWNNASCTPTPTPPQDYGIELVSSCMWNNITENTANNNLQYGIRIAGICNYNQITNNHAEENQYTGIGVESSNNVIVARNTVERNVVFGIRYAIN
jgi:parallel beta-helix repeat protein